MTHADADPLSRSGKVQAFALCRVPAQGAVQLHQAVAQHTVAEIAAVLGCGEPTARVHHHRACRNLRTWLQGGDDLVFSELPGGNQS